MKTKTAHTPGPWIADIAGWPLIVNADEPKDNQEIICTVDERDGSEGAKASNTQREANARLIAAAPELLAAAENARNVLAALAVGDLETIKADSPALLQLRAAIEKATRAEVR